MARSIPLVAAIVTLGLGASTASADIGWSLSAGAAQTDNATRVETNKVDDTLATVGGSLAFVHESRRIEASLVGNGTYLEYLDDTYDSDFIASAEGTLKFGIVPDRFLWTVENTFGQVSINQFEPVTPDNRQNANFFSTGPDVILRLGNQMELRLSGRYGDSRYEETDTVDDQRLSGSLELVRRASPRAAWGVGMSAQRVDYDLTGSPGYDQQSAYGTLQAESARQTLRLDLGATRLADGGESYTNPLLRVEWSRRLTPSWTMDLTAGSEYRNSSDRFVAGQELQQGTGQISISGVPSESSYGGLSLTFERPRTRFSVGSAYSQEQFVAGGSADEKTWSFTASASRRFSQRLEGFVDANYEDRDLGAAIGTDATTTLAARMDWALGRKVFLTAGYRYEDRSSDRNTDSYTENLVFLSIAYRYGEGVESRGLNF